MTTANTTDTIQADESGVPAVLHVPDALTDVRVKMLPEPVTSEPVKTDSHLTNEERLELLYLSAMVERSALMVGRVQADAANDELQLKVAQEQLQRMQTEFALRNMKRASDIAIYQRDQTKHMSNLLLFRKALGIKYGFDPDTASFDDMTGKIHITSASADAASTDNPS